MEGTWTPTLPHSIRIIWTPVWTAYSPHQRNDPRWQVALFRIASRKQDPKLLERYCEGESQTSAFEERSAGPPPCPWLWTCQSQRGLPPIAASQRGKGAQWPEARVKGRRE